MEVGIPVHFNFDGDSMLLELQARLPAPLFVQDPWALLVEKAIQLPSIRLLWLLWSLLDVLVEGGCWLKTFLESLLLLSKQAGAPVLLNKIAFHPPCEVAVLVEPWAERPAQGTRRNGLSMCRISVTFAQLSGSRSSNGATICCGTRQ